MCPLKRGMARKRANSSEWNRLDAYALAFHERVRQGYFALAEAEPERWLIIDATEDKGSRTASPAQGHPDPA
jgi:dTMP kinase